ncbi:ubiquinol-cytochrome c reductase iron-sulfur subunit [Dolichospermum sp. ST_con]|nr:ubiquinol-cytochrome c reductase iron-sulfur subunit [Dolichospermum sp. ST_con]MDD1421374.1 ubiquinol-cytochrome c reductase iron-sulfur subunit [Dolichospermum sp. ST_sed1]MDD1426804.1 ubiquinol-cytochrome c reductase iron-sulfur subunit [Dolichospermum sp. ST_sed9]MDD1433001.1 ubiquinol-cytochrome c reductase iron-sulfur subunit [Dolichospermum sp. ST_sed6]MDD1437464.1 ubiquinol-cytochrome c reductase iron-sulfur subunit [Dolichospermum sp. ST_sed10]MDD1442627.1 ubiquinol-cytochrome c re
MKRRDFINWVGLGCLASSLPVAIAACSPETSTSANAATKGWQKVGTVAQLNKTGQLLVENSPIGAVLVVRTSKATKNLIAVNPSCTHQGCTIDWKAKDSKFVCPCHGAEFAKDGKVKQSPAKKPLKTYQAKIEGSSVLVKAT